MKIPIREKPARTVRPMAALSLTFAVLAALAWAILRAAPGTARSAAIAELKGTPQPLLDQDFYVVRAYFDDDGMVDELSTWTEPWEVNREAGYVVLGVSGAEFDLLQVLGFEVVVDEELTRLATEPRLGGPEIGAGGYPAIPGFACYRTVEGSYMTAEDLVAAHPTLAAWVDVGDSWEKEQPGGAAGYDLMVLVLTNQDIPGPKPRLFVTSSIHAREYAPAELMTRYAEYLLNNYDSDPDVTWILDHHEVHLMLQANPDGRKWAETGILWRKNTDNNFCSNSNLRGVDLNRNFEFGWDCCGGSSADQCSEVYHGPSAGSEPETQAVQAYLQAIFPDQRGPGLTDPAPEDATGVYLDIHSYSELVIWPWGFTDDPAPNGVALQTLGRKFAYFNGYSPFQAIDLYITDGTTADFGYGDLGVASFVFEIGTWFFQACSTFENTVLPENLPALLFAAKTARTPYMSPAGPEALGLGLSAETVAAGTAVTLTVTLNDTRYNNSVGGEPVQTIQAAEVYVDVPYWEPGAVAHPLAPADGNFNTSVEAAVAVVDTSGLAAGRHILYVRGQDADGNWGVVSAVFLWVEEPAAGYLIYLPVLIRE